MTQDDEMNRLSSGRSGIFIEGPYLVSFCFTSKMSHGLLTKVFVTGQDGPKITREFPCISDSCLFHKMWFVTGRFHVFTSVFSFDV